MRAAFFSALRAKRISSLLLRFFRFTGWTFVDGKVPFNEEGEVREEFLADLQTTVSELYDNFIDHVATYRGMDKQIIRDTNVGVYSAKKSLELGLVDKIKEII